MSVPMVAIGDVVEDVMSWNPAALPQPRPIRYIDLSAVDKDAKRVMNDLVVEVLSNEAPSRARQLVAANDVLVSTVRPNLNGVALLDASLDGATASTGYCVLRPSKTKLDAKYLRYWVESVAFVDEMTRLATGASYPAVSDAIIKASRIPLPPLPTQRRIAAVLDKAQALVANDRRTLAVYDQLAKSLFLEMFGDPVRNERGWPERTLSEVVKPDKIITYGIVQAGPPQEDGVPYIRTGDIADGRILVHRLLRTTPEIAASYERSRCSAGDIVMSIRATIGTTAIVPPSLEGVNLTQGTARISPDHSAVTTEYLHWAIKSDGVQMKIDREAKGATFREITLTRLRDIPISVPPLESQRRFSAMIKSYEVQCELTEASLRRSEGLYGCLLQEAFSGMLF